MLIKHQTNLEAQFPDVDSALAELENGPSRPLMLIVDMSDSIPVSKLRQLATSCRGHPVLALVDELRDPSLLFEVQRIGAVQTVTLPIQPDAFETAMETIAQQLEQVPDENQTICLSGVTGGCGATSLAVNLAYEIASQHHRHVVLGELSLQIGKLAAYLDISPALTTFDLLNDSDRIAPDEVRRALTRVANQMDVLAGEYRVITPVPASTASVLRLVDSCRSLADIVIFDVPCTYDELYFQTLAASDQIVLVGEQKIPSIRTLKLVCEAISRFDGAHKLHIVMNRYDPHMRGFSADRLRSLLEVNDILTVCNDFASVMTAINHGKPLRQQAPYSPALKDIGRVAQSLFDMPSTAMADDSDLTSATHGPSGFRRLLRRIGLTS